VRSATRWLLLLALGFCARPTLPAQTRSPLEYQLKAVFLFNFTLFTEWPAQAFTTPDAPLVICVLGDDPFGPHLDEAARGEIVNQRPVIVRRIRRLEDLPDCHVVFISQSEASRLGRILTALHGRPILTVSDTEGFSARGGMIRFLTEGSKIRLQINVDATKLAGLTLSSKLLRPADIVTNRQN
jgi:hypothetical protein